MKRLFTILTGLCLLVGNAWADDFYCAVFSEDDAFIEGDDSKLVNFARNQGKPSCDWDDMTEEEGDGYYEDPFPGSACDDGAHMYRLVCVRPGTCNYFRSTSFCSVGTNESCGTNQTKMSMSEPSVGSWIQNGLAVEWERDLNYDSAFTEDNFDICVDCDYSPDKGSWSSATAGRQWRTVKNYGTALRGYYEGCPVIDLPSEYQCVENYYGNITPQPTTNSSLICTACPLVCGIASTSTVGTTTVSDCCVAAGSTGSDVKGAFRLKTAACATED